MPTDRSVTRAQHGMVACPHAQASEAGVEILKAGGSAVDAAIAASAVLSVVYPHMTSVGGDQFWLIRDASSGSVRFLNAGGRAAASGTIDWFSRRGLAEIPFRGIIPATLTTPGAAAGWCEAHASLGRLPLARDLAAAIECARDGFPVGERLATWTGKTAAVLAEHPESAAVYLPGGGPPKAGQRLRNPDLALTLERIGALGREGFYEGETGRELARFSREHGGLFTERDLSEQRARWGEPVSTTYRGVTINATVCFTLPQCIAVAEAAERGTRVAPWVRFYIQCGSQDVKRYCEERGYLELFQKVGATFLEPSCGACINAGPGVSKTRDEVTISAINRNFPGRSGPGQLYLANPYTVAASAITGYITEWHAGMALAPAE